MKNPSRTAEDEQRRSRAALGGTNRHEVTLQRKATDLKTATATMRTTTTMRDGARATEGVRRHGKKNEAAGASGAHSQRTVEVCATLVAAASDVCSKRTRAPLR
jgi:hypothetical protein